jgi:hypothetical protein
LRKADPDVGIEAQSADLTAWLQHRPANYIQEKFGEIILPGAAGLRKALRCI